MSTDGMQGAAGGGYGHEPGTGTPQVPPAAPVPGHPAGSPSGPVQGPQPGYGYPQQPPAPPQGAVPQGPGPQGSTPPGPGPQGSPPQPYGYGYGGPQPAAPPQAPPAGYGAPGFGAPQAPQAPSPSPSPGYGPPQQPPPGYGFPPQPPQPAQPYGQPAQGYGQPGPAYGQPAQAYGGPAQAYGQPGSVHGGPVGPVGAPQPGAGRKKPVGMIVLLVTAVLVLSGAGFGAWYMLVGSASNNVLWSVAGKKNGDDTAAVLGAKTRGTWFTDKAVIQTMPDGVKAYDLASGKQMWATALPGDSSEACVAPENSAGDIGIVAYGEGKACDHVVAYDLDSGKVLWDKDLKPGDTTSKDQVSVARAGDVVVINAAKVTLALKAADGTTAWDPKKFATEDCPSGEFTGGKALIRVRGCQINDFDDPDWGRNWDEVSLIDPATGRPRWTYHHKVPEDSFGELDGRDVVSTSPVVLIRHGDDGEALFSLDDETGKVRSQFSPATPSEYVMTSDSRGGPWSEAGTFGNTFVISTSGKKSEHLLAAYDLDSGKQLWKTDAVEFRSFYPLPAAGGDRILAYKSSDSSDKGPELVQFDAEDGTMKTVVEYPVDIRKGMSITARPYWHDDRLYVSEPNPSVVYGETPYTLVALPTTD
ncbi:outer membrane protein assembly factor BamB [Streptomyces sp. SAI-135]|uniref:outer membrane protein assembly factor BamB family protein n=1 Tax=unclassified Streptomyces TaxID=2593676 RepID=UPI002474A049|nr:MULTISPECIES: PQQ-binding-like beta-propeller repeat protein [unclassified Streptomyces]MDH6516089.1 outer membrane protein assembly factor BamB [Streptomyces sp. SAI-090]MDH6587673.1 outer membrane protein assembly factor BamB [Streptomyces sp. SAI-133]MDH6619824.1 outer membrane protein assembly factor BamB [Streptomyces sp. SAI-135]